MKKSRIGKTIIRQQARQMQLRQGRVKKILPPYDKVHTEMDIIHDGCQLV